jgi:phage/conjugal plasmid C-4 type zinc finger TraR family protein
MSDEMDHAQAREEEMRSDALAALRRRWGATPGASAVRCVVCDEPIPAARRQAVPGVRTCIECQRDDEQHTSLNRGTP